MAHLKKFGKTAIGHMTKHYERAKDEFGEYIKFGNQDINTSKSHLNYNLAPNRSNQVEFIKNRCKEVKCLNREDVKVMCSWVVTKPKGLEQEEEFFQKTYEFLENRYGKENVVSAYVHRDEITPHMHFSFVPVVFDKKKEVYKVSAKEKVSISDLRSFHGDLENYLEKHFGKEVGILNEATKEGNRAIKELKRESAKERFKKAMEESSKIVSKAQKEAEGIEHSLMPIKAEYKARKAFIDQSIKDSDVSVMYPNYVEVVKKGVFRKEEYVVLPKEKWEAKHISVGQIQALKREHEVLEKEIKAIHNSDTIKKIEYLEQEVEGLKKQNKELTQNLNKSNKELVKFVEFFNENPEIEKEFLRSKKEMKKNISLER